MNELIQFFAEITTSERTSLIVFGLLFFLCLESGLPLFKMKYKKLTLTNFRTFHGKHEITFPDKNGIFLVHAQNGVGKSAIYHAFRYVLYGETKSQDTREKLWLAFNVVNKVEQHFIELIETGKLASKQLEDFRTSIKNKKF